MGTHTESLDKHKRVIVVNNVKIIQIKSAVDLGKIQYIKFAVLFLNWSFFKYLDILIFWIYQDRISSSGNVLVYQGCYNDRTFPRALQYKQTIYNTRLNYYPKMTNELCTETCETKSFVYSGTSDS